MGRHLVCRGQRLMFPTAIAVACCSPTRTPEKPASRAEKQSALGAKGCVCPLQPQCLPVQSHKRLQSRLLARLKSGYLTQEVA